MMCNLHALLGNNGHAKFMKEHTWDAIVNDHYDPLFDSLIPTAAPTANNG